MADSGKPLISTEDIGTMFARMEDILVVNRALLEKLTYRIAKWNVVQKIGDVCVEVVRLLSLSFSFSLSHFHLRPFSRMEYTY
jgi:hypothetical protein